jgi:hypothetical protein
MPDGRSVKVTIDGINYYVYPGGPEIARQRKNYSLATYARDYAGQHVSRYPQMAKPDGISCDPQLRPYVTRAIALFQKGVEDKKYEAGETSEFHKPLNFRKTDYWTLIDLGEDPKNSKVHIVAQVISEADIPIFDPAPTQWIPPLKIKAIQLSRMGESVESPLFRNPESIYKTAQEMYDNKKWAEFLNGAIEVGKYIPIVKTAIAVDEILDQARKDPSKLTVWDFAGATWSFVDDVLTVTGPFLKPGTFAVKGIQGAGKGAKEIKIVVAATEGAKAAEGATVAERAGARAVERKLLQYTEGEGETFVQRGAKVLAEEEGAVGKAVTAIEKGEAIAPGKLFDAAEIVGSTTPRVPYTAEQVATLRTQVERLSRGVDKTGPVRITVIQNEELLKLCKADAGFMSPEAVQTVVRDAPELAERLGLNTIAEKGQGVIVVGNSPNYATTIHEVFHMEHWMTDPTLYGKASEIIKEKYVFEKLLEPQIWSSLSQSEKADAIGRMETYLKQSNATGKFRSDVEALITKAKGQ